jgi:hypothetical protein
LHSLASELNQGNRRSVEARLRLAQAYRSVFKDGSVDADLVLSDLAEYAGWYKVVDPSAGPYVMTDANARRAVFGRLFHWLRLTSNEIEELERAVRLEQAVSNSEGQI